MTIKEFSNLCGCNPQTIRYYDRMNLLKPVKVDDWTGYRFYDEEQALDFVKIKNLQTAGFSIDEIKGLLNASDEAIYDAFSQKIKALPEIQPKRCTLSSRTILAIYLYTLQIQIPAQNTGTYKDSSPNSGTDKQLLHQLTE